MYHQTFKTTAEIVSNSSDATKAQQCAKSSRHITLQSTNAMHKFETNISRKGIVLPQSQFPHSCVCERFIYSHDLICLLFCRK